MGLGYPVPTPGTSRPRHCRSRVSREPHGERSGSEVTEDWELMVRGGGSRQTEVRRSAGCRDLVTSSTGRAGRLSSWTVTKTGPVRRIEARSKILPRKDVGRLIGK